MNETLIREIRYVICGCGCVTCNDCNDRSPMDMFLLLAEALNEVMQDDAMVAFLRLTDFSELIASFKEQRELYGRCCKDNIFPLIRRLLGYIYITLHEYANIEDQPLFKIDKMTQCFINSNVGFSNIRIT